MVVITTPIVNVNGLRRRCRFSRLTLNRWFRGRFVKRCRRLVSDRSGGRARVSGIRISPCVLRVG